MKPLLTLPLIFSMLLAPLAGSASERPPLRFILDMVHDNPGEKPFETKFHDPALLKTWGCNGQFIKTFPQAALTYDSFDPELLPKGSPERA